MRNLRCQENEQLPWHLWPSKNVISPQDIHVWHLDPWRLPYMWEQWIFAPVTKLRLPWWEDDPGASGWAPVNHMWPVRLTESGCTRSGKQEVTWQRKQRERLADASLLTEVGKGPMIPGMNICSSSSQKREGNLFSPRASGGCPALPVTWKPMPWNWSPTWPPRVREHKNLLVEVAQLWSFVTAATDPKTVSERILLYLSPLCFLVFVFAFVFLAAHAARSSWDRDWTCSTAVTMPAPLPIEPPGNSHFPKFLPLKMWVLAATAWFWVLSPFLPHCCHFQ